MVLGHPCHYFEGIRILPSTRKKSNNFLPMKTDKNGPSKSNKQKTYLKNLFFLSSSQHPLRKKTESANPDPYQNVTDPQHCLKVLFLTLLPICSFPVNILYHQELRFLFRYLECILHVEMFNFSLLRKVRVVGRLTSFDPTTCCGELAGE
jgi:hypothetical protein